MVEWLGEAIERFSRERRLMIVLDDVQWADELTCLALRQLVPGPAASPVVWLLGRRSFPEQDAVERLIAEGDAERLPLPPLTATEAADLCGRILGAEPGPPVLEWARAAGGNPFLLEEVLTGLRDQGRIEVVSGAATIKGGGWGVGDGVELPSGFGAAVERRLCDLSPEALRLLEVASVLRRPFTVHEAAGMLGAAPGSVLAHVRQAVAAGALVEVAGGEAAHRVAAQLSAMALVPALHGVLGHVALLRDELDTARRHLDRGRELACDGPGLVAVELRWRRGSSRDR